LLFAISCFCRPQPEIKIRQNYKAKFLPVTSAAFLDAFV
jgi:hypothetical protein